VCVCVCVCVFPEEDGYSLWTGQSGTQMGGEATEIIKTKRFVHLVIQCYLKNRN